MPMTASASQPTNAGYGRQTSIVNFRLVGQLVAPKIGFGIKWKQRVLINRVIAFAICFMLEEMLSNATKTATLRVLRVHGLALWHAANMPVYLCNQPPTIYLVNGQPIACQCISML